MIRFDKVLSPPGVWSLIMNDNILQQEYVENMNKRRAKEHVAESNKKYRILNDFGI
jgi:hypothetical protein